MKYYVAIMREYSMAVYSEDEAAIRDYCREYYHEDKPPIYAMTEDEITSFRRKTRYYIEEVREQFDDLYCTDSDMDMIIDLAEGDVSALYETLKTTRKMLKLFRGEKANELRAAIKAFLNERVPNNEMSIDDDDKVGILIEKLNIKKYFKSLVKKRIEGRLKEPL